MADRHDPHADHDPLLIAGLLDRDLSEAERATAEVRVATCPDCAALRADLVALSSAARALPVPARARDFRLTAADADRLAATAPREPATAYARPTGVMTDRPTTPHAAHDEMLVASLADHSLPDVERAAAEALVASCRACAELHADIVALRAATLTMPTPTRPRDYTLTADDAARLRSRGWRRLVSVFGTARDSFSRPLAVGLTTLGIAGLLVASLPSIITGAVTSGSGTLSAVGAALPGGPGLAAPGSNPAAENASGAAAVPAAAPTAGASGTKSVDAGGAITSPGPVAAPVSSPIADYGVAQPGRASAGPAPGIGQDTGISGGASPTPDLLRGLESSIRGAQALEQLQLPPLAIVSGM
ncbi:MAG: hypothetical protein QOE42_1481, partial [Chloroflexota bacterium]|nr:hypothetical protein [Chloroflexota bacterium]